MAKGLFAALQDISPAMKIDLASELRTWEGQGNAQAQQQLISAAKPEIERVIGHGNAINWQVWVTYHNYYKAPDLIGPAVSRHLEIPYVLVEASRSRRRLTGPWSVFAQKAEQACDDADCILYMTERDHPALKQNKSDTQVLFRLQPFLNRTELPALTQRPASNSSLLAVGMLRSGDKFESYRQLADSLAFVKDSEWTLTIVGDGPAACEIKALFADYERRVTFVGLLDSDGVAEQMSQAAALVWPGVNEAFGMVYLEAQSHGLPVIAQDRPGVRDVISPESQSPPPDDPRAFAKAIDRMLSRLQDQKVEQHAIRDYVSQNHLRPAATACLTQALKSLVKEAA
ncbi:MAG: glycosyltransferase [Rhodobacteraceae bacterium]|nr:glycosyltransferase [Paracoccaceae bacterium]